MALCSPAFDSEFLGHACYSGTVVHAQELRSVTHGHGMKHYSILRSRGEYHTRVQDCKHVTIPWLHLKGYRNSYSNNSML